MAAGQAVGAVHEVRGVDQGGSAHTDRRGPPQWDLEGAVYHQAESCTQGELKNQASPDRHGEQVLDQSEQCEGEHGRQTHERDIEPDHRVSSALLVRRDEDGCPGGE